jgi:hypothetical protein
MRMGRTVQTILGRHLPAFQQRVPPVVQLHLPLALRHRRAALGLARQTVLQPLEQPGLMEQVMLPRF